MKHFSRRDFLRISAYLSATLVISTGLTGCDESSDSNKDATTSVAFNHGVASGDPLSDAIIIWTRITPLNGQEEIIVNYEVATDETFSTLIHNGSATLTAQSDFTLKVDVQNLDAATRYFYRFHHAGVYSEVGQMKTLPQGSVDSVNLAVFSCANYTNGYFNAYEEASKLADLDAAIHLGDYIYEYGMFSDEAKTIPAYATANATTIGRELPDDNDTECLTLEDYRKRYALYRSDKGLQALHKNVAMIVVWDDHEIANDSFKEGAENHNEGESSFTDRVNAALQAYFEWLPIRPVSDKKMIFRSFTFGDLLDIHALETRIFGRDEQLNYSNYYDAQGVFDVGAFSADIGNPSRSMLGQTQLQWLQNQLTSSTAKWQVLAQQVLMGKMLLPAELLTPIAQLENPAAYGTTTEAIQAQINTSIQELSVLKLRLLEGDTLSEGELARLTTTLAYNLDAWDGYFVEREVIYATAKALGKNLVVLAGDTHNGWASNLKDIDGNAIGVEFATSSVSSPGLEEYLHISSTQMGAQLEGALTLLIDDLEYTNITDRGFMQVQFTHEEARSTWHYVSSNNSSSYTMNTARTKTLSVKNGENQLT